MTSPHSHWSLFDETLEMADFDVLHAKLLAGENFDAEIEALRKKAHGYGYGEADSVLCDLENRDPSSPYTQALQEQFDNYLEGQYFNCVDESLNILKKAKPEKGAEIQKLGAVICSAYEAGRKERIELSENPSPRM